MSKTVNEYLGKINLSSTSNSFLLHIDLPLV